MRIFSVDYKTAEDMKVKKGIDVFDNNDDEKEEIWEWIHEEAQLHSVKI